MSKIVYAEWNEAVKRADPVIDKKSKTMVDQMSIALKERMDNAHRYNKAEAKVLAENKSYQRLLRAIQTEVDLVMKKLKKFEAQGKLKKGMIDDGKRGGEFIPRIQKAEQIVKRYWDNLVNEGTGEIATVGIAPASRGQAQSWKLPQVLAKEAWHKDVEAPVIKLFDSSNRFMKLFKKQLATQVFEQSKVPAYLVKLEKLALAVELEQTRLMGYNSRRNRSGVKFEVEAKKLRHQLTSLKHQCRPMAHDADKFLQSIKHIERRISHLEM